MRERCTVSGVKPAPVPVPVQDAPALRDRVAALILGRINDGTYPVGSLLPARPILVDELGVSRSTVDSACRVLAAEGHPLGVPGRGRGTVVLDPLNPPVGPEVLVRRSQGQSETWRGPAANRETVEHVKAVIRYRIADHTYSPSQRIPSVAGIAEEFSTSRWLARQAVDALKEEGILYSRSPRGHFVCPAREGAPRSATSQAGQRPCAATPLAEDHARHDMLPLPSTRRSASGRGTKDRALSHRRTRT